ncbi:MAG: amidohydrolase family protein [Candidatus Caldarchaeum sp.]
MLLVPRIKYLRLWSAILATVSFIGSVFAQSSSVELPYLLKSARVVIAPGRVLEKADVLISQGVIQSVAPNIQAPPGVQIVDCEGLTVYPGLIHPLLAVTIGDLDQRAQATRPKVENDLWDRAYNVSSRLRLADITAESLAVIRSLAQKGYGVVHVYAPAGIFGPRTAVFSTLSGTLSPDTLITADLGIPIQFSVRGFGAPVSPSSPQQQQRRGYPSSLMGAIAFVRQSFYDAERYRRIVRPTEADPTGLPRPPYDPDWEAVDILLRRDAFAIFDNLDELTALQAMEIVKEFNLKPLYAFRSSAGYVTDLLRSLTVPIILRDSVPAPPRLEEDDGRNSLSAVQSYFNELQIGAELERQNISFCYAPSDTTNPLGDLRLMVRAGLSKDSALSALTVRPAEFLGILRSVGTVEAGKVANVLIVQGDLFEESSQIMTVFVEGKRLDMPMPPKKKPEELKTSEPLSVLPVDYSPFPRPAEEKPAFRLYKNATIWTMSSAGVLQNADILIRDGKIVGVGKNISAPPGCEVVDATGKHITPGIWDCHSHTAISGNVNEGTNMVSIECRIKDVINHRDINIYRQLAGGTVGGQQLHGSANAIGGQTSVTKWRWGKRPKEMIVSGAPEGVKFALGENPIDEEGTRSGDRPRTRMGVEDAIRQAFDSAQAYRAEWEAYRKGIFKTEPRKNLQMEALVELLEGKRFVHSHGYRQDEFLALIRLCEAYGVKIKTFQHVLEGYKIADEMAKAGIGGSTFADWWGYKLEAYDAIPYNAALMWERGVSVSINSDSNDHARRLNVEAAKSMRYGGVDPVTALSFVTIEPAKQMGIDRYTGSLELGKDADIVIWSGSPVSIYSIVEETYVDGIKLYDRKHHQKEMERRREVLKKAREILHLDRSNEENDGRHRPTEEVRPISVPGLGKVESVAGNARYPRNPVLITGATIHPMKGEPFVGDVLIDRNGLIAGVGKVNAPRDAIRVDGKGKHLYPGIVDAATTLGLVEVPRIPVSVDVSERGDFNPQLRVERAINPESALLYVARSAGVLTALTRPTGAGIPGQAALLSLDGYTWEDFTLNGGRAVVGSLGGGGGGFGGFRQAEASPRAESVLQRVSEHLKRAREYVEHRKLAEQGSIPPFPRDEKMEVMARVALREIPLLVEVYTANDMKAVIEWAERENVALQLMGCTEADQIADYLAKKQVPIILFPVISPPRRAEDPVDQNYTLPARLLKAGVRFCLASNASHDVRQIRDMAGFASAYGVPKEDAVRAITLWPAEILGLGHRLGAIFPGYEGTLILTDGDLLEVGTQVLRAWIRGREVDLLDKQKQLWEKYHKRPKTTL